MCSHAQIIRDFARIKFIVVLEWGELSIDIEHISAFITGSDSFRGLTPETPSIRLCR